MKDGTITAATSSSISDGAAALVLMRESTAAKLGLAPIARIVGTAVHANAPEWFTTAPVGAIQKLLDKNGWDAKSVDLWEVNEAFAAVTMAAMAEFKLPHEIVNVNGGAVALGPPDRRLGRPHPGHPDRRAQAPWSEARRGRAVHRWWRGNSRRGRDPVNLDLGR